MPEGPATTRLHYSPQSVVARFESSRRRWFGPAEEQPFQRRMSDRIRLATAVVVTVFLARHAGDVTRTERAIFQFFNTLPGGLQSFFETLYRFGALWAVALVGAAALLARRWRLARDLVLSGGLAWGLARVIGLIAVEHASLRRSLDAITRLGVTTPNFPSARLAVVVAVVAGASPYLTRPSRRFNKVLVVAVVGAAMYLGVSNPNDLAAGIVLGWGVAAGVHLLFGSPGGHPTIDQITASLAELGIAARDVHLAPRQPDAAGARHRRARPALGEGDRPRRGGLPVPRQAGALHGLQGLGPDLLLHPPPAAAVRGVHDAAGTRDRHPDPRRPHRRHRRPGRGAARGPSRRGSPSRRRRPERRHRRGPRHAVVPGRVSARRPRRARRPERPPRRLERRGSRHRRLPGRVGHGPPVSRAADIAELLTATAAMVGEDRAVRAAVRGVGQGAFSDALRFLQPAALTRETRLAAAGGKAGGRKELAERLAQLRHLGAEAAGTKEPQLQRLYRVSPANLLLAVGTLIAVGALLSQIGDPNQLVHAAQNANWAWLGVAFVLAMATNVGFAIALLGTVPNRLPLGPTMELQVAMSFSNLAIPAVGGTAVQIRFLQKQGADLASAIAAGGLLSTAALIVTQAGLFGLAVWLSPNEIRFANINTGSLVPFLLIVVLVLGVAAGLVLGVRRLRRVVLPPIEHAVGTIWGALRSPRRLLLLVGGNVLAMVLYGFCLQACLAAFGARLSFWSLLAANIFLGTLASLVPIPGGSTAVASVGLAGALVAFGVPKEIAVAAILTNQLVVNYLPAVPGWVATTRLVRRGFI